MPSLAQSEVVARGVELAAPPDTIDAVHRFFIDLWEGLEEVAGSDRYRFELALTELASNVFQHAGPNAAVRCSVQVEITSQRLSGIVSDSGPPVHLDLESRVMPDALEESGRGIALIHLLVDSLSYARVDDRNVWRIVRAPRDAA